MALPAIFDPIVNAPKIQKLILGLFGIVALGVGAYFLLFSPLWVSIAALEAQNASLKIELARDRAAVADLARFRREIAELERKIEKLKERLPTEKELPPLYRKITDAAAEAGLGVALFQPREPRPTDYYSEIPISLTSEAGYHQVGAFVEMLARLPRLVNVAEFKMTGLTKSKNSLRAEFTLATYMYRPVGSPPVSKPGTPGAPGAPR